MRHFEVHWQFEGSWLRPRVSLVLARNEQEAEDQVWLHHVEYTRLRERIVFVEIKEMMG